VPTPRWLTAGLLLALITPVLAQEAKPVKLEWKFEKGKTFYQTTTSDVVLTMKFDGREVVEKQKQTFILSWTPTKQEDKNWVLKMKIEGLHVDLETPGKKVTYDSTRNDNESNRVSDFYKALVGSEFTLTLGPELKATKIEGREDFIKKLIAANPQMETLVDRLVSDDTLKAIAELVFGAVPNMEVKKGDKWERTQTQSLSGLGASDVKLTYTDDGPGTGANVEKFAVKAKGTYKPPTEKTFGTPFKVTGADAEVDGEGTVEFRKDKGRVVKSEMKLTLKGKLKVNTESSDKDTDVDVTRTQTTTVTTSDENPIPKKN